MRASSLAVVVLVLSVGCEGAPAPCEPVEGCLRAERLDGACGCAEWAIVGEEEVPLKYVVVSVLYPMEGNASAVQYGGTGTDPFYVADYTPIGARLRVRVRRPDGSEVVARVRSVDDGGGPWAVRTVTPASVLVSAPRKAPLIHRSVVDLPQHDRDDRILVWVNPRAVLATHFDDSRTIRWTAGGSTQSACEAETPTVVSLSPAQVDGTAPADDPCATAFVETLSSAERADLRRHDGFLEPPGRLWDAFYADPRFPTLENTMPFRRLQILSKALTWWMSGPPSDADDALLRSQRTLPSGDEVTVEHLVVGDPAEPDRTLGYVLSTSTDGCEFSGAGLVLDLAFGTAAMMVAADWPIDYPPACTR